MNDFIKDLHTISNGELMEIFTNNHRHYFKTYANVPTYTMGGNTFWTNIWEVDGWKVQRCDILQSLFPHYRILNPKNIRIGWSLDEKQFKDDVHHFANLVRAAKALNDRRYGIVFSGGGGKGSYQIGVWKYLHELGIDKKITGISGSSVGALNSLLFLQGSYDKAFETWMSVQQDDFTNIDVDNIWKSLKFLNPIPAVAEAFNIICCNPKAFVPSLFSQDRLRNIIQENIDPITLMNNIKNKMTFSALTDIAVGSYYPSWVGRSFEDICNLVLTSAALPGAFPMQLFDGRWCVDGGCMDNIPVKPLLDLYDHIIVLHLSPDNSKEKEAWKHSISKCDVHDKTFYHVYPSSSKYMDKFHNTIIVNREITQTRMRFGYYDAKEQLKELVQFERDNSLVSRDKLTDNSIEYIRKNWR